MVAAWLTTSYPSSFKFAFAFTLALLSIFASPLIKVAPTWRKPTAPFLWVILWYQPQPLISDEPFVTHNTVFHIKTQACKGSIQGTLLSFPTCWPFYVLVLVMGRLSRKRRHGFFYFALPTFVILSIIISTAWAEAPVAWNLHHIDSCAKP